VTVCGDIDHLNVATLAQALTATVKAGSGTTLLDLCNVGFVDSTVLHALLEAQRSLRAARARLLLASPLSREMERLLEITGARTYFTFTNDAAAHQHCRPEPGQPAQHLEVLTKALDVSVGDEPGGEAEDGLVDVVAAFPSDP
jgi:anti-anti-sigma factor